MTILLARVTLPNISGIPRDAFVNDFVFQGSSAAVIEAITDAAVANFYNTVGVGGHRISEFISTIVDRVAQTKVDYYDITTHLDGGPHGSPVHAAPFTLGNPTAASSNMPESDAMCLSYHGLYNNALEVGGSDANVPTQEEAIDVGAPAVHTGKDRPRARLRGRIFLGPFTVNAIFGGTNSKPATNLVTAVHDAATAMIALTTGPWCVWSRRNASVATINGGFTDDSWDQHRSREQPPSARTLFGLAP